MKLSVVIPAFNEAACIEQCLASVAAALQANVGDGLESEVIVVDNNSTDNTAELARNAGARVVFEPVNHIAKARNAGGRAASGDWLLFLDADTLLPTETLADALAVMRSGKAVGGGSTIDYGKLPLVSSMFVLVCNTVVRVARMTPGCFIFCRADAFRGVGGFDERYFAGEDGELGKALKRWGRKRGLALKILHRHPPRTSDRKFRQYGLRKIFVAVAKYVFLPRSTMMDKRHLDMFYEGRR